MTAVPDHADLSLFALKDMPEVREGEDLATQVIDACERRSLSLTGTDIVIITQKVVSKSEGRLVSLSSIKASPFAGQLGRTLNKDPRLMEVVLRETRRIVKMGPGVLICETVHGFVCAQAGVDQSNLEDEDVVSLLPADPDRSARTIRRDIESLTGQAPAVLITDTWGRPWRLGQVNFCIGAAGLPVLSDYRGQTDRFGRRLKSSVIATADEIAGAAELVMGKTRAVPAVVMRGYRFGDQDRESEVHTAGRRARDLIRPEAEDLFR